VWCPVMDLDEIVRLRARIRDEVWSRLEREGVALPPFPVKGRIPNFRGALEAARRLAGLPEWRDARTVKVNPDSPQRHVRLTALREGKTLIMPTPRLRSGFLLLDPKIIPPRLYSRAATIRGAFKYGVLLKTLDDLSRMPHIDFIVEGSVAVDRNCNRLGKGEGYGDIEYAILSTTGKVDCDTPIATTVSDLQIVENIPRMPHDVPVDIIVTPSRVIRCSNSCAGRPSGILLESLEERKIREIPLLRELLRER